MKTLFFLFITALNVHKILKKIKFQGVSVQYLFQFIYKNECFICF